MIRPNRSERTRTRKVEKKSTDHDDYGNNNKIYLNNNAYFYPLLQVIIRLDGS